MISERKSGSRAAFVDRYDRAVRYVCVVFCIKEDELGYAASPEIAEFRVALATSARHDGENAVRGFVST